MAFLSFSTNSAGLFSNALFSLKVSSFPLWFKGCGFNFLRLFSDLEFKHLFLPGLCVCLCKGIFYICWMFSVSE